jgi:hypothetical protein
VLADALADALEQCDGLPKQRMAGAFAAAWYVAATAALDHLRGFDPAVPDVTERPLAILRLLKVAGRDQF